MGTEPGTQLHEEPQSERGPKGSRDAGPDQAGAGQTDRKPGSLNQEEVTSSAESGTNPTTTWTPAERSHRSPGRLPAVPSPRRPRRHPPHTPPRPRAATPEWDPRIKEASARPKTRSDCCYENSCVISVPKHH